MTDRELLEAAARAAGLTILQVRDYEDDASVVPSPPYAVVASGGGGLDFDPFNSDGDALRLAAQLKMGLHYETQSWPTAEDFNVREDKHLVEVYSGHRDDGSCHCSTEDYTDDPYAATRRAIVRAAAALDAGRMDGEKE